MLFFASPDLFLPCQFRFAIKDDQVCLVGAYVHGIADSLLQPIFHRRFQRAAEQLEFDHDALERAVGVLLHVKGPHDGKIRAFSPKAVLPVDVPAVIYDALQERLHDQLWGCLLIQERLAPDVGILAIELLERLQQSVHVKPVFLRDIPLLPLVRDARLRHCYEFTGDHLLVDAVAGC